MQQSTAITVLHITQIVHTHKVLLVVSSTPFYPGLWAHAIQAEPLELACVIPMVDPAQSTFVRISGAPSRSESDGVTGPHHRVHTGVSPLGREP